MSTLIFGIALIIAVFFGIGSEGFGAYVEGLSIILVLGGTLAILMTATPFDVMRSLLKSIGALFRKQETILSYQASLVGLAKNRDQKLEAKHPLIQYAVELWSQGVDSDLFGHLLLQKKEDLENKSLDGIQALKNLVKYPPALGMAGTVMGMVQLFSTLDENKSEIGHHLSLAMTATFLGLIIANFLVSPIADRLQVQQVHHERLLQQIYEMLILVNQGEPDSLIKDEIHGRVA